MVDASLFRKWTMHQLSSTGYSKLETLLVLDKKNKNKIRNRWRNLKKTLKT